MDMPLARTPIRIELDEVTRALLEEVANAQAMPYRDVVRARIILLVAGGVPLGEIGRRFDTPRRIVRKWAERFQRLGLRGLNDASRSGRPPLFSPDRDDVPREARVRAT
jgi:transposase